jgi:hypothetical protein
LNSTIFLFSSFSGLCWFLKHRTNVESDEDERNHNEDVEETAETVVNLSMRYQSNADGVADKVGRNWALSSFMLRNYGAKIDEVEKK